MTPYLTDALYPVAAQSVFKLRANGEILHSTAQVFVEFRNVATRPAVVNGLGFDIATADRQIAGFEADFPLLPETPDIYIAWKALVSRGSIIGKQVHDARLAAICEVYGLSHILTFNASHFARLAIHVPGLTVVDPATV